MLKPKQSINMLYFKYVSEFIFSSKSEEKTKWRSYVFLRETYPMRKYVDYLFLGYPIIRIYSDNKPYLLEIITKEIATTDEDFFVRFTSPIEDDEYFIGSNKKLQDMGMAHYEANMPEYLNNIMSEIGININTKTYGLFYYSTSDSLERQMQEEGYLYSEILKEIKNDIDEVYELRKR